MMVRINRGKDAHVEVPMLVSLTKNALILFKECQILFQVRAIDREKEDGWIRGYFRNGYLSQGQFAYIWGA